MDKLTAQTVWQVTAGLLANVPPTQLPPQAAAYTDNVVFFDGKMVTRPGFQADPALTPTTFLDTNSSLTHMGILTTQGGDYWILRTQVNNTGAVMKIYATQGAGVETDISPSPDASIAGDGSRPSSTQFKGEWLLAPGGSNLLRWTGSLLTPLVDVTAAQSRASLKAPASPYFVCATASRVFMANSIDLDSGLRVPWRVSYSATANSSVWDADDSGIPEQQDAGFQDLIHEQSPITGLVFLGGTTIIVLKRHSIYHGVFKGSPIWYDFIPISLSRGCIAPGSVRTYNDTLIWLGDDLNVYTLTSNGQITNVGDVIRPILEEFYNPLYDHSVTSMVDFVRSLYWLYIPYDRNGEVKNYVFVLNLKTGAWSQSSVADKALLLQAALYLWPNTPFYGNSLQAKQLWGGNDGKIYLVDYDNPIMIDKATKFTAEWRGRVYDLISDTKGAVEVAEFSKCSLHASTGMAIPQFRIGNNLKALEFAAPGQGLTEYTAQDADSYPSISYVSNRRADAGRFGQFCIKWPLGIGNPAQIEGYTVWGLPREKLR